MARKRSKHSDKDGAAEANLNGAAAETPEPAEESSGGGGGIGKLVLLLLIAAIAALVLSEGLRSKVLDVLFGAEEEFDYSSTTMPASEAPVGASAS
jgi:hypothetical protein